MDEVYSFMSRTPREHVFAPSIPKRRHSLRVDSPLRRSCCRRLTLIPLSNCLSGNPLIVLATEDVLSEHAGLRLAVEAGLQVSQLIRRNGKGYLQSRIRNFCQMATFQTVLVIADLDRARCPSELLADWFGTREVPSGLIVRIAVREVEAWILADHQAMRELVGSRAGRLPDDPEM